jgi:2-C-methyl-D-erythritol 2,4-cyclodiphosphate synthase
MRVGIGFDIHPLAKGRKLILGGVLIPFNKGLSGHSDGDILVHSICDALLGAAAKRDIGFHFPNTPRYKGISSLILLKKVSDKIRKSFSVINIDSTVIIEKPRLSGYIGKMKKNIAAALGIEISRVNVKSGTGKGLGLIGGELAAASFAVACVDDHNKSTK